MESYYLFNVVENGDKVLVAFFPDKQQALDAIDPGANQSLEVENMTGKEVLFSRDRGTLDRG